MLERQIARSELIRCALCKDAPCTAACGKLDPARILRSLWFDAEKAAAANFPAVNPCAACAAPCEASCIRAHQVPIRSLLTRVHGEVKPNLAVALPERRVHPARRQVGVGLQRHADGGRCPCPCQCLSSLYPKNADFASRASTVTPLLLLRAELVALCSATTTVLPLM